MASKNDVDVIIMLGAQIIQSGTNEIVPSFHGAARCAALAYILQNKNSNAKILISGGHNVGVRYTIPDNTHLVPANFSMQAFSAAKLYPSEAQCMQQYTCAHFGKHLLHASNCYLEEYSATTIENAKFCKCFLERVGFLKQDAKPKIALLTNLFHMQRALHVFLQYAQVDAVPLYAEDFAILHKDSPQWSSELLAYYETEKGGKLFNVAKMKQIFDARRNGDLIRSVAELV